MENKITTALAKYIEQRAEQRRAAQSMTENLMISSTAAVLGAYLHKIKPPSKRSDGLVDIEYLSSNDLKKYLKYHPGTDGLYDLIMGLEKKDLEDLSVAIDMRLKEL